MIIKYKQLNNSKQGNPRIEVVEHPYSYEFDRLLKVKGGFTVLKGNRIVSVANADWVYSVCNNATVDFHGIKVRFELI